jgi:DNA-binding CsgD family transcriptional regulator
MPSARSAGGLPANAAEIVREVAGIAAAPGTLVERAEAVLAQVQRVVGFDAGWIALLVPGQDSHVPLARSGDDERVCGYLDSPAMLADAELVGLNRSPRPVRGRDMPVPLSAIAGWVEYVEPAGFRDGVSSGLFTAAGHHLGLLALHTRAADQVSDAARDLLGLLTTSIAAAVDPLRSLAAIAGLVHQAAAGIVLAPSGAVLPLPGLPDHRLLTPGSAVLAAAALQLAEGGPHASFLARLPEPADTQTHARVTVLAAPLELRAFAGSVVLVSPVGDLHGLTHRELQVLGVLVTGASNGQIAAALGISVRTVEVHVDHLRAKLDSPSRTTAAARALRLGLFVPAPPGVGRGAHRSSAALLGGTPP